MIQTEFSYPIDYETFWQLFGAGDQYANRKYAAYTQRWLARSEADRRAMIDHLRRYGAPKNRNPYFWIQDFVSGAEQPRAALPPASPKNYNGSREFEKMVATGRLCTAEYNGEVGIYTIEDAEAHRMTIFKRLQS